MVKQTMRVTSKKKSVKRDELPQCWGRFCQHLPIQWDFQGRSKPMWLGGNNLVGDSSRDLFIL